MSDENSTPIRVLIVDDHAVVRRGLNVIVSTEPGMQVAGQAANGLEAVEAVKKLSPDVVLMDLQMPKMNGVDAIKEIAKDTSGVRILVLTSFAEDDHVFPAIRAGAQGYLLKDSTPEELTQAIRDVSRGMASLDPSIARKLMREFSGAGENEVRQEPLTPREHEVLELIAKGHTNREIAEELVVSEWTARTHVRNILAKLHLANRTQAALFAVRKGLADGSTNTDSD